MSKAIKIILLVSLILGVLLCIGLIALFDLNDKESALLSVILSIFSILATLLVAHHYAEKQHNQAIQEVQEFHRNNLRTYAKKAAEKVNNLSNELGKLSVFLNDELSRTDIENIQELLLTHEERIRSAIHLINTLKSVNDTSLSDWEGVLDDLLAQQREEKEEKEEELREMLERVEILTLMQQSSPIIESGSNEDIKSEIFEIRKDIESMATKLGITQVPLIKKSKASKHSVSIKCSQCEHPLDYTQRKKKASYKAITCSNCNAQFISRYNDDEGFYLVKRGNVSEKVHCPRCEHIQNTELNNYPASSAEVICESCGTNYKAIRKPDSTLKFRMLASKLDNSNRALTDKDVEKVKNALPQQPWPKHIHKNVAKELGLSNAIVSKAITELIHRGDFKPQIGGVLYVPEKDIN